MCIAHDLFKILPQQRLSAGDAQHLVTDPEIGLDLVQECPVLRRRQLLRERLPAAASAMQAALIAALCQLQEQLPQTRLLPKAVPVFPQRRLMALLAHKREAAKKIGS